MGEESVHVSLGAIRRVEAALGRFAARLRERLPAVAQEIRRAEELWQDRVRDLRREIATLESQARRGGDEDESAWIDGKLEEARAALDGVERLARRIEDAQSLWVAQRATAEGLAGDQASRARTFLRGIEADLTAYLATTLDASGAGLGSGAWGVASAIETTGSSDLDETRFSLPDGFVWVPIENIASSSDGHGYASAGRFEKAPREVIANGFALLRSEVLPTITLAPTADSGTFLAADQVAGRPYEGGAQGAYDAFFGDSPIVLARRPGHGELEVTDGRHRILVARDLGWTAVPARIL